MKNLPFRLATVIKCLKQSLTLNCVVLVSIVTGLFYPCCLIGSFNYNLSNMELSQKLAQQDFITAEIMMPFVSEDKIQSAFQIETADMPQVGVSAAIIRVPVFLKGKSAFVYVQGVDNSILNRSDRLVSGRMPTKTEFEENAPVAVLSADIMQSTNTAVGDNVTVNGQSFKIIGSVLRGGLIGTVFVPYALVEEVALNNNLQYQLLFKSNENDAAQINRQIREKYPAAQILSIRSAEEIGIEQQSALVSVGTISALQSVFTLLLSVFATTLIACGKLVSERRTIAIKLANGATRKDTIIDCIFEIFIFSVIAGVIDLLIMYIFKSELSNIVTVLFSWRLALLCLATMAAFSILVGFISGLIATRFNVAKILKV